ncbi:uncharacterized protein LOC125198781 [Salvia hispanica]|uniref:uncharacterized protein LOC125198781 n=1 Tax=Salvia hispanica TaxID=49212 RepID=UPI002008F14A|nr:uncharacterized protein LOC125198781 [Salvia hispanica]
MPPRRNVRNGEPTSQASVEESVTQPRPPSPPPPPRVDREVVKLFLDQKPPTFDGRVEPAKAETWIRALERIFKTLVCNDAEKMICVTHPLTGSADFWWDTKLKTMPQDRIDEMTWEEFKTDVYDKYVPKSYRKAKAAEFHNLTLGRLSVTEYDSALCDMTRYAPKQTDTDEKLADKFREGLRHEIRMALAVRGTLTYAKALALALDVEEAMPKERSAGNTPTALPPPRPNHDKRRWDESRIPYDNKRYRPAQNRPPYGGGQTSFNPRSDPRARPPQRNVCAKTHFGECRGPNPTSCFNCGGNGHFSRECLCRNVGTGSRQNHQGFHQQPRAPPTGSGVNRSQPPRLQQPVRPRLPAPARAYAIS